MSIKKLFDQACKENGTVDYSKKLTAKNIRNYRVLQRYLAKGKFPFDTEFSMQHYDTNNCRCAVGMFEYIERKMWITEPWENFVSRHFGINNSIVVSNGFDKHPLYRWLFHASWCSYDNTAKGAAKRIEIFIKNGYKVPKNFVMTQVT